MAKAENEVFEFVVVVILVGIVAMAIWLYFKSTGFDPASWLNRAIASLESILRGSLPNLSSSPGSGIATGSGGSGSGAYQVLINSSQGNWSTPPLGG